MIPSLAARHSWFEATARKRVAGLLDAGSFVEILPPVESSPSPHLAKLDLPGAFDDGIVIGCGQLEKKPIFIAAQEGQFMGGALSPKSVKWQCVRMSARCRMRRLPAK